MLVVGGHAGEGAGAEPYCWFSCLAKNLPAFMFWGARFPAIAECALASPKTTVLAKREFAYVTWDVC